MAGTGRERVVVVGADAAGMSAAHQALRTGRRTGRDLDVVVLERGHDTSYSACGIPYWIGGEVSTREDLVARSAQEHRDAGIDLRCEVTAVGLDLASRTVQTQDGVDVGFDHLVIATGAQPIVPDWARGESHDGGRWVGGVRTVKTLTDGDTWRMMLDRGTPRGRVRSAVVIGGGYIGVETAEAFLRRGLEVTLVTRGEVMGSLDPDMGARVRDQLERAGVRVVSDRTVDGIDLDSSTWVRRVHAGDLSLDADVVALGIGVRPATEWLGGALPLGEAGGLLPDQTQAVPGVEGVWAGGDCCEHVERLTGRRVAVALGTHAVKQGRVAGTSLAGGTARFGGVLGTAITQFSIGDVHCEVARTGPSLAQAREAGFDVVELTTESSTAAGYLAAADPIAVKVTAQRTSGRLIGMQIVGGRGAGKRIDTAAAALWAELTVHDVAAMDLSYVPPLSPTLDPVQIACRRLSDRI